MQSGKERPDPFDAAFLLTRYGWGVTRSTPARRSPCCAEQASPSPRTPEHPTHLDAQLRTARALERAHRTVELGHEVIGAADADA
jgi:hypothetical protein